MTAWRPADLFTYRFTHLFAHRFTFDFLVDLLFLALAAPFLYFPNRFSGWALAIGVLFLACGWLWRKVRLRLWHAKTPADWPLFFLFCCMLPIAIWAAPDSLRQQYSWPRAYILLWNFSLFWTLVTHASRQVENWRLALGGFYLATLLIALLAPLGIDWLYKFPGFAGLVAVIPRPLLGIFSGAESGFHPNQVGGTLLYALPLMIAHSIKREQSVSVWSIWLLRVATLVVGLVLLLTQSRASLLGLVAGLALIVFLPRRWGRALLLVALVGAALALFFLPAGWVDVIAGSPSLEAVGGTESVTGFRLEVWRQAINGIYDFAFTGMGLGTFRQVVRLLYPLAVDPGYDLGHAHNFFLQTALDLGVPGLIALLAVYWVTILQVVTAWRRKVVAAQLAVGLLAALGAQTVYSQLDAVTMGAKTNFLFWWLLALSLGVGSMTYPIKKCNTM
jgi:O-antigen ligase